MTAPPSQTYSTTSTSSQGHEEATLSKFIDENSKLVTSIAAFVALTAFSSQLGNNELRFFFAAVSFLIAILLSLELYSQIPSLPHHWRLKAFWEVFPLLVVFMGFYWVSTFPQVWVPIIGMLLQMIILLGPPTLITHLVAKAIPVVALRLFKRQIHKDVMMRVSQIVFILLACLMLVGLLWVSRRVAAHPIKLNISSLTIEKPVENQAATTPAAGTVSGVSSWHEAFSPATWSTWALVLIGILGTVAAMVSLRFIFQQTKATQVASDAAKMSVDAAINSERAWVMVDVSWVPHERVKVVDGASASSENNTGLYVRIDCSNRGKTPAQIIEKRICLFVTRIGKELPKEPNLEIDVFDAEPHYIQSNEQWAKDDWVIGEGNRGPMDFVKVYVYGVVKYRHLFSETPAQTTFGYELVGNNKLERLIGYPAYNKYV